jgi:nicotinamide riboside transporter PnuC
MAFEAFKWILAGLSIVGVVLNIRKLRSCFYVWAATNFAWAAVDLWHGVWAQAALQVIYFALALWGILAWRK